MDNIPGKNAAASQNLVINPPDQVPSTNPFFVKLLGFLDRDHCAYVQILDRSDFNKFSNLMRTIKVYYSRTDAATSIIPLNNIKKDMFVIAKLQSESGDNIFIRAKVQNVLDNEQSGMVKVWDVDDCREHTISNQNIYRISKEALSLPSLSLKVELPGLQIFQGTDFVIRAFNKSCFVNTDVYLAKSKGKIAGSLCLSMCDFRKEFLHEKILQNIPLVCKVPLPDINKDMPIKLIHFNDKGFFWYQAEDANSQCLMNTLDAFDQVVQLENLAQGDSTDLQEVKNRLARPDFESEVFATPYSVNGRLYRAVVRKKVAENQVQVYFIDYGNDEVVNIDRLIVIDRLDKVLKMIPPQARKVKLMAVDQVNVNILATVIENSSNARMMLLDNTKEVPQVEIYLEQGTGEAYSLVNLISHGMNLKSTVAV